MSRYSATERLGVNAVEGIVLNEFGWIFREQMIVDMGIDAHIELVEDGNPVGKLIAVQIKTGPSHFHESRNSYTYYGSLEHYDYWLNHSLPVILVAHFPDEGTTYWVEVNESNAIKTKKQWKIDIPKSQQLDKSSKLPISLLFAGTPIQQKLRQLTINSGFMKHIHTGGKICITLEEWINKSLGRTPIQVIVQNADGSEVVEQEWFYMYTGLTILQLVHRLFPWALVTVDEEFYGIHDELSTTSPYEDHPSHDFEPDSEESIYPYSNAAGEVDYYRLQLHLNELGRSYLVVHEFLSPTSAA